MDFNIEEVRQEKDGSNTIRISGDPEALAACLRGLNESGLYKQNIRVVTKEEAREAIKADPEGFGKILVQAYKEPDATFACNDHMAVSWKRNPDMVGINNMLNLYLNDSLMTGTAPIPEIEYKGTKYVEVLGIKVPMTME